MPTAAGAEHNHAAPRAAAEHSLVDGAAAARCYKGTARFRPLREPRGILEGWALGHTVALLDVEEEVLAAHSFADCPSLEVSEIATDQQTALAAHLLALASTERSFDLEPVSELPWPGLKALA